MNAQFNTPKQFLRSAMQYLSTVENEDMDNHTTVFEEMAAGLVLVHIDLHNAGSPDEWARRVRAVYDDRLYNGGFVESSVEHITPDLNAVQLTVSRIGKIRNQGWVHSFRPRPAYPAPLPRFDDGLSRSMEMGDLVKVEFGPQPEPVKIEHTNTVGSRLTLADVLPLLRE